jgi:hypothetical protein
MLQVRGEGFSSHNSVLPRPSSGSAMLDVDG